MESLVQMRIVVVLLGLSIAIGGVVSAQETPVAPLPWADIDSVLAAGEFEATRQTLTAFATDNPEHPRLGDVRYYLAYLEENPDRRTQALERFVEGYPRHHLVPAAIAELARYHQLIGNTGDAASQWQRLLMNYRQDPLAGDALYWLGIIALERRDYNGARVRFNDLRRDFENHPKVPWGHLAAADSYFLEGEFVQAVTEYIQSITLFPQSDLAADLHLRLGQTYERLGDLAKAESEYALITERYSASLNAPIARERLRRLKDHGQRNGAGSENAESTDSTITVSLVDSTRIDSLPIPGRYGIQLGSFLNAANARELSDKLRASGYDVQIRRVARDGRTHHQVIIGAYLTLEEARQAGQEFTAREGLPFFLTPY